VRLLHAFPVRFAVFFASTHFLVYYAVTGAYLLVERDSAAFWPLFHILSVLTWPAELLSPLMMRFGWWFPPAAAIPVAFASVIYALAASIIWVVARPFIRWAPPGRLIRWSRIVAFVAAIVLLSWLFFGVVCAFAGEFMLGIVDMARYYPGEFLYSRVRLGISIVLWVLTVFASYRFIFAPRQHVIPATA
jgi:hypothetical protein